MKNIFTSCILLLLTACSSSISSNKTEAFWLWFVENRAEFEHLNEATRNEKDEKLNQLLEQLLKIDDGLAVEVSNESQGVRDLVISAEGDKEKFPVVKEIVQTAPFIPGWTVTAFRQRSDDDFTLQYRSLRFTPSDMYFYPIAEGDSLDLIIYSKGLKNHNPDTVAFYGLIAMDNVLGEYDCVMKVRHYDFQDLVDEKDKSNLKPLKDLPDYVDSFHRNNQRNKSQ
ncbi:hypothetical protein [Hymenobacter jejuensis]|uniref:Lipoprotein n=1 Tax=Hymenobacter jejuensis TaxID=2502781 RepID=A0A5B8A397_9BACT|nr:hypothetical protein [Hymenobacter jejuensis]QDA61904.1 hypothetical protein FHG12_18175 [Hymenobacter jejuensis]